MILLSNNLFKPFLVYLFSFSRHFYIKTKIKHTKNEKKLQKTTKKLQKNKGAKRKYIYTQEQTKFRSQIGCNLPKNKS